MNIIRVKLETAQRLKDLAKSMLRIDQVSFIELEKFLGICEFCQLVSTKGRTMSFHLSTLLAKTASLGRTLAETKIIKITKEARTELKYWNNIMDHRHMKLKKVRENTHWINTYSDASNQRWACQIGEEEKTSKNFDLDDEQMTIFLKELSAVRSLFKLYLDKEDAFIRCNIDNQAVVNVLKKKKGNSLRANVIIGDILKIQEEKNLTVEFNWIDTELMRIARDVEKSIFDLCIIIFFSF